MSAGAISAASADLSRLIEQVRAAGAERTPLVAAGGGTKHFLSGRDTSTSGCEVIRAPSGITSYEPTELVITAGAGTLLQDIEQTLAEHDQMLGFEPPRCGVASTIGGVVASGLSGPSRPYLGSVRDYVLGADVVTGRAQHLSFGGQVIKNVAGYDVSRLLTGSWGALGVITQVSVRVVPRPDRVATLGWSLSPAESLARLRALACAPWPVTASLINHEGLWLRVAGSAHAVDDARTRLAPDTVIDDPAWWDAVRDLRAQLALCETGGLLWRLSLPAATATDAFDCPLIEWGGAQRWLVDPDCSEQVRLDCLAQDGHATVYAGPYDSSVATFTAPAAPLANLADRIRASFDPDGLFTAPASLLGKAA